MEAPALFVERRSAARLRETPLRRRSQLRTSPVDRRARSGFSVADVLEQNLDRYPTKAAMSTFLQGLLYAAESAGEGNWRPDYVAALKQAADVVHTATGPIEALATLHGYRAFTTRRGASSDVAYSTPLAKLPHD